MYASVGYTLLGGLLTSIAVMIVGLLLSVASGGSVKHVLPLDGVASRLAHGDHRAILDIGILLLFATPLAGVLVALIGFLRLRDYVFASTTALLLVMLVIAFAVALH